MDFQISAGIPADPQPTPPVEAPKHNALIGPNGLRAGWKYLFFLILLVIGVFLFSTAAVLLLGKPVRHQPIPIKNMFGFEVGEAIAVLLVTALMAKVIDKKPFGYFGLPGNRAFRSEFWTGAVIGFLALTVQLTIMHLCGWFDFGHIVLHGAAILKYGAFWGLFFLCTGFFEEGMLRGYPQRVVTDGFSFLGRTWGFWLTALIFSIMFACLHLGNPGENKFGIFMVFIDGLTMCFSLWRTGNMWFAVGNHAAWDWSQTFFYGTPDSGMKPHGALFAPSFHGPILFSGGADGPEGSVLVVLAELLIVLSIALIYRNRKYPLLADELATPLPEITLDPSVAPPQSV